MRTSKHILSHPFSIFVFLLFAGTTTMGQDTTAAAEPVADTTAPAPSKPKPVKNTWNSVWLIDNQTTLVPVKGTLEFDISHRFGPVTNGYEDFWGFFASSNIRLGATYVFTDRLNVGIGITKFNVLWDVNAKYAIITQTPDQYAFSVSYYFNAAVDTRKDVFIYDGSEIKHFTDRISFFNQILIARKVTEKLSLQVAPSWSHQNAVGGYYTKNDSTGQEKYGSMKHEHFAVAVSGRLNLTPVTSLIFNYDQPLTKHPEHNPSPNVSFGFEFNTSNHTFQLFAGNFYYLNPQRNNLYNDSSPFGYTDKVTGEKVKGGQFRIGFNITRLWNY